MVIWNVWLPLEILRGRSALDLYPKGHFFSALDKCFVPVLLQSRAEAPFRNEDSGTILYQVMQSFPATPVEKTGIRALQN